MAQLRGLPTGSGETTECGRSSGAENFCTACLEGKFTLLLLVNLNTTNPQPELEKVLQFLYHVKGDGVLNNKSHNLPGNRTV